MPKRFEPSKSISVADPLADGRLLSPSAERNADPIADVLKQYAPRTGQALELASGTGQHVIAFSAALPELIWQPSEIDGTRLDSINSWSKTHPAPNLKPPIHLDATLPGWSARHASQDLIVLINLLHLISAVEAKTIVSEVGLALQTGGRFILYGPFFRDGRATSDGDQKFDAHLRTQDPETGYKDIANVHCWMGNAGMKVVATVEMPANNLLTVCEKYEEAL